MKTVALLLLLALIFFSCFFCVKKVVVPVITHTTEKAVDHSQAYTLGTANE